jgi:hypothetical protein
MANRWGIPKDVEKFVRQRDSSCVYCGISFVNEVQTHKTRPMWEHIINDIKINDSDNIALCFGSCNASKGKKLIFDWLNSKYCATNNITKDKVADVVKHYFKKNTDDTSR